MTEYVTQRSAKRKWNIGRTVQEIRARAGLTQDELAERMGISREAVSQLERRGQAQWAERVLSLAAALQCHPGELFGPLPGLSPDEQHLLKVWRSLAEGEKDGLLYLMQQLSGGDIPWTGLDRRRNSR